MCEPTNHSHKPLKELKCNCCGKAIEVLTESGICEDYLLITKKWGYFSNKDLTKHSFIICEKCYDNWIKTFTLPVEEMAVTELFEGME